MLTFISLSLFFTLSLYLRFMDLYVYVLLMYETYDRTAVLLDQDTLVRFFILRAYF